MTLADQSNTYRDAEFLQADDGTVCDDAFKAGKVAASNRMLLNVVAGITVVVGIIALTMALMGMLSSGLGMASVLIVTGSVGLLSVVRRRKGIHLAAVSALSIVGVTSGVLLLALPMAHLDALTGTLIGYFAACGFMRLYFGLRAWRDGGAMLVVLGFMALVVAWQLYAKSPLEALWLPGALLAIDLMLWGALLLEFAARQARSVRRRAGLL